MEFTVKEKLLWSTPVWECPVSGVDNTPIKEYCLRVKKQKPGVTISNRGGWHSQELIFPVVQELELLFKNISIFINDVCAVYTGINTLVLGNWWININGKGDYNTPHNHQNSILSGVYYVSVPDKNMGDLVLHREDASEYFLTNRIKRRDSLINTSIESYSAEESKFILFPSWTRHSVNRNESAKERISIAFNFVAQEQY